MSFLSALSARAPASALLPAAVQAGGRSVGAQLTPASGNIAPRMPVVDPVSLYNDNVSLSPQSMMNRVGELASSTVESAQGFLDTFVGKLFGDAAKGATVRFDAVAVQAQSAFAAANTQAGSVRSSAFSLQESASFIGTGQLVTADGRSFDFELEVRYEASAGAATQETGEAPAGARPDRIALPDVLVLTGKPLPPVKYPGSLDDLFKLLGRELEANVNGASGENGGNLSLRLLRLVDSAALLAPRPRADQPEPPAQDRSKALASSYGSAPAGAGMLARA
ncbi:hypothetical protein HF313_23450 [Massilia atriviolacea]|uniref:Uncharacterized protein n=1 Tax=Massilia atriviolacea TaxID=2495579 RepID=A0A430HKH7_9BURK|nr:hypothetical protein [Massilia atriviolacea]RSZ58010.1 hypothetical protein EJB06_17040 [Massilia atriviolacea]